MRLFSSKSMVALVVGVLGTGANLAAAAPISLFEDFNDGVLDSRLTASTTGNYSIVLNGVDAEMSGIGRGDGAFITANFKLIGDFTISVKVSRASGIGFYGAAGPEIAWLTPPANVGGFSDVFLHGPNNINGNIFVDTYISGNSNGNSDPSGTLRLSRVGNTITMEYDMGSGFVGVPGSLTDGGFGGIVRPSIFLLGNEPVNDPNDYAHDVRFDDLSITGTTIRRGAGGGIPGVPEPATLVLFGAGLAGLGVMHRRRKTREDA
jgi:hypothetical protein